MRAKEFTQKLFESKLSYQGNCTDDDVIEYLFGDATGFAQAVEEYGDDFELDDLVVKYDPETDIHSFYYKQKSVTEDTQHISQDLEDVADWMNTTPDKLNIVVKQEPIEKFIKQIREMYGTYDEFPEDEERTNRILKLLKRGAKPLPMYVEANDPDLFVMEGRHRMVAFWLVGMTTIPIAYVSVKDKQGVAEGLEDQFKFELDLDQERLYVYDQRGGPAGRVEFYNPDPSDTKTIDIALIVVRPQYQRQGLASAMYRYLEKQGYKILRPTELTPDGEKFFGKIKQQGVAEDTVDEMALSTYKTMGDFSKPGPFRGPDKKLVPHAKNIEKATQFFEKTPFDFRLFFSNIPGTGKYSEQGPMSHDEIRKIFGQDSEEIINGSEDAITVVYVGNKGDRKVMLTPWMMAHRFGHAIQAGARNANWSAWKEAEKYFFQTVNSVLEEHYGKLKTGAITPANWSTPQRSWPIWNMTPEYNALFNAMGTQRSSKTGQIRRPYEFLYELFAQYLGTGKVTLNPLPTNLTYGRQVFGNPTKYMNIKPEYRDELSRTQEADRLAYTMELLFNDVLGDSMGQIFVM